MAITSKERAALRGQASTMETIMQIGKDGITDSVIASANEAFNTHELIKIKVLESSMLSAREACDALSAATGSEQIQVIGTKFVLYRKCKEKKKKR